MMRLATLFALVMIGIASVKAQSFEIEGKQKVHTFYPNANDPMDCYVHVTNLKKTNMIFGYEKLFVDYPAKWDVSFCDNRNCFSSFILKDTMGLVGSGKDGSLKITVFPNGVADTAIVKYLVYDYENPNDIDTITWRIYVRWGADSRSMIAETVCVFPNPTVDFLHVKGLLGGRVVVLNSAGQAVLNIDRFDGLVNVADWVAGQYTLQWSDGVEKYNHSFIKK